MPLKKTSGLLAAFVLSASLFTGHALAWSPKKAAIMTKWAALVDPAKPLPEYPRPQMARADWLNLNGLWQFQPGTEGDAPPAAGAKLSDEILVPFPVESALSGVMQHHDRLWYRRTFTVPAAWAGKRAWLHFGAVDWESEVFVNGKSLGVHQGGYDPFSYDVTDALKNGGQGEQELVVRVYDPTDNRGQPRGKQSLYPGGIMYTSVTGIWQTVWMEPVDKAGIRSLKIVPDVDKGALKLSVNTDLPTAGNTVSVQVKDGAKVVANVTGQKADSELTIPVPGAKLWSPDSPFLYDLEISVTADGKAVDMVKSYFGMRKIEIAEENGVKKMFLNGKFLWNHGPLDQGFWPDGIYTQPTEEALKYDIEMTKAFGFNMIRKHIKVEPARWYYWTDKLGLVVWQDMPSTNSYIGGGRKAPPIDKEAYERELKRMVETLFNVPSIIMWEPYNEGQGQYDTPRIVDLIKSLDPTRLVNEASGGGHTGSGDVHDIHAYPPPQCPKPHAKQALACGEFGGIGLRVTDHTWTNKGSGLYTDVHDSQDLLDLYAEFCNKLKTFRDVNGMSAAVYTQITDVENEINGLMTYDRIPKADPALLRKANTFQYKLPTYKAVVPTSEETPQSWQYTTEKPADGWTKPEFSDSAWKQGQGGFGDVPGVKGKTDWKSSDIWLRRHFKTGMLGETDMNRLLLRMLHDEDVQVYINGTLAYQHKGFIGSYGNFKLTPEGKKALHTNGDNVLAVHCSQTEGGQFIDVGLTVRVPANN